MAEFEMKIDSGNEAFAGSAGAHEVARLLRQTAEKIEQGEEGGGLLDFNGNKCGLWIIDDERPAFEDCEAEELFRLADDYGVTLEDDPRELSRASLVGGLESIGCACYDDEDDDLLAAAYGDSMLAGDLPGDCDGWRDAIREAWEQLKRQTSPRARAIRYRRAGLFQEGQAMNKALHLLIHSEPRWRCPACGSTKVQISLPTWYRETRGYELEFQQTDEGADPLWWICDDCEETGKGEPIDVNEEKRL